MADDRPRLVTALASTLKAARESRGWSQRRLADEVASAGLEVSSAYVGLIEAGHRIPAEAVVRALAGVLERDADEWIKLRSYAESDKWLAEMARHIDPAAFVGVARALAHLRATPNTPVHDLDPTAVTAGAKWMQDFLESHGQTPMSELKQHDESLDADLSISAAVAAEGDAAWLSGSGGPRRGRRYELATKLFDLVADLDADEMQRVIGYTEAVRDNRRPHVANPAK